MLRVVDPVQGGQEPVRCVDDVQVDPGGGDVVAFDLLGLTCPQEAVVDEDARQLIADGAVDQRCGDGGRRPTAITRLPPT